MQVDFPSNAEYVFYEDSKKYKMPCSALQHLILTKLFPNVTFVGRLESCIACRNTRDLNSIA